MHGCGDWWSLIDVARPRWSCLCVIGCFCVLMGKKNSVWCLYLGDCDSQLTKWTIEIAIPRNTVLLATKYTRYSLFHKYEAFKHGLLCNCRSLFLWVSSCSFLVATFGSKNTTNASQKHDCCHEHKGHSPWNVIQKGLSDGAHNKQSSTWSCHNKSRYKRAPLYKVPL